MDAVGLESYEYAELVRMIRSVVGSRSKIIPLPPSLVYWASRLVGGLVHDVVLTRDEISGLMANLLVSRQLPTGKTSLRTWLREHAAMIGVKYASELARHYR